MAVFPTDLLEPSGELDASMFPDDDAPAFDARLAAYIARGVEAASPLVTMPTYDDAVKAWALSLAFSAVAARLALAPASASLQGLGGMSTSATQITYFRDRAIVYRNLFSSLIGGAQQATTQQLPGSVARRTIVGF